MENLQEIIEESIIDIKPEVDVGKIIETTMETQDIHPYLSNSVNSLIQSEVYNCTLNSKVEMDVSVSPLKQTDVKNDEVHMKIKDMQLQTEEHYNISPSVKQEVNNHLDMEIQLDYKIIDTYDMDAQVVPKRESENEDNGTAVKIKSDVEDYKFDDDINESASLVEIGGQHNLHFDQQFKGI